MWRLRHTFLYNVSTPQFCITQCFPPNDCIRERFQDFLRGHYSDGIPLSGPAAAGRPLYDILELFEPLWPQSGPPRQTSNKTVEGSSWPVKFSAFLEKLQQHGFCALMPEGKNRPNQQDFLKDCLIKVPRLKIWWAALSAMLWPTTMTVIATTTSRLRHLGIRRETSCVCAVKAGSTLPGAFIFVQ